jgi:hypothetical protein
MNGIAFNPLPQARLLTRNSSVSAAHLNAPSTQCAPNGVTHA